MFARSWPSLSCVYFVGVSCRKSSNFISVQHASEDVEKMILGNKCDMIDRRVVSRERGEKIAADHSVRFLETSAKANINIDKAFYDLAEAILDKVSLVLVKIV